MKVVPNTSPLIFLSKIDRLSILNQIYTKIIVPQSVVNELSVKPEEKNPLQNLLKRGNFLQKTASRKYIQKISPDLGAGERETLALGLETNADLVIIDELQGRNVARDHNLSFTGTIGVLIEAHEREIIPSVQKELDRLIESGMWIDETFYNTILEAVKE